MSICLKPSLRIYILIFGLILINACTKKDQPSTNSIPPPEVGSITIKQETIDLYVELPGRTSAYAAAEIRPQVNGIILERMFEEGGLVKAGQQLYQIDPSIYQAAYDTASAQLARSKALIDSSSSLEKRYKELLKINAVSQQEYVDAAASLAQARADVDVAKAAEKTAEINLNYTKVFSPIDGRIGKSAVTAGALVTANQGMALALVQQLDPIYVDVTQSSTDIIKLRQKIASGKMEGNNGETEVKVVLNDANYEYEKTGILKFSDVTVEQETGNVSIRALFPNPDNKLLPGLFVRAIIKQGQINNAILVPQQSITRNQDGSAVAWIVDKDSKVNTVPVELGDAIKDKWIVIKGLEPGQKVIVEGLVKVRPGTPVRTVDISDKKNLLAFSSVNNNILPICKISLQSDIKACTDSKTRVI
jgi:membrane fusion protein (multidrug efflux system)